jgi:hypothetical protein
MSVYTGGPSGSSSGRSAGLAAWITAGATLLAAVIGALVLWATHDKPVPPIQGPPAKMSGSIGTVYESIANPCCTFSVKITADGFAGKTCTLDSTVVDAETGTQVLHSQICG